MSGYREIQRTQSRQSVVPAQIAKALIGTRHGKTEALDRPRHSRELGTGPPNGKIRQT